MRHELKCNRQYLRDITDGRKLFEVRRDDRGFEVGDLLFLREFDDGQYGESSIEARVSYLLRGGKFGIEDGFVVLGIRPLYHTAVPRVNVITAQREDGGER